MKRNVFRVLRFLGIGGTSLDGILKMLTKLDSALEAYEAEEKARIASKSAKAARLQAEADAATAEVERAGRVRERVQDLVS